MADPQLRVDYETALGAFILTFNEADFYLSQIVGWELHRCGLGEKLSRLTEGGIAARIDVAEALAARSTQPGTAALTFDRLRAINTIRNQLAHGHFEQNPFQGSYQIVLRQRYFDFPAARVRQVERELDAIVHQLRSAYYCYFFSDIEAGEGGAGSS